MNFNLRASTAALRAGIFGYNRRMPRMLIYFVFVIVLFVEIGADHFGAGTVQMIAKSILMPILSPVILFAEKSDGGIRAAAIFALFFSWAGDVLLIFARSSPEFFLAGLGAFLLAHVAFIACFVLIRRVRGISGRAPIIAIAATGAYAVGMFSVIAPKAAAMAFPVAAYAIVIGGMLIAAISAWDRKSAPGGKICVVGALLFLISDSILGINRFAMPIPYSHALVMITYGAAQVLLVEGIARTLNAKTEHTA